MKKLIAMIIAFSICLCGCQGVGETNSAELYKCGLEAIDNMNGKVEATLQTGDVDSDIYELMNEYINRSSAKLKSVYEVSVVEIYPQSQVSIRDSAWEMCVNYTGLLGRRAISTASQCSVSVDFQHLQLDAPMLYIYDFTGCFPIAVYFNQQSEDSIVATTWLMFGNPLGEGRGQEIQELEDLFETYVDVKVTATRVR